MACVQFSKGSLSQNGAGLQKDWLQSNILADLSIVGCEIEDLSALSNCSGLLRLDITSCFERKLHFGNQRVPYAPLHLSAEVYKVAL